MNISRQYTVHVILGDPSAEPVWHWSRWLQVAKLIDPLIQRARGRPLIQSLQQSEKRKFLKFGRLTWSQDSHAKWTHDSPVTNNDSKSWMFHSAYVEVPSFAVCYEQKQPCDVLFHVCAQHEIDGVLTFNPAIVLAVAEELQAEQLIIGAVTGIASLVSAKLVAKQVRPYGIAIANGGYQDGLIDSTKILGYFKGGNWQARGPVIDTLNDEHAVWTEVILE